MLAGAGRGDAPSKEERDHEELQRRRQQKQQQQQDQRPHSRQASRQRDSTQPIGVRGASPDERSSVSQSRSSSLKPGGKPQSGRPGSAPSLGHPLVRSESRTRKLSHEEAVRRQNATVRMFREAHIVNRNAKSEEDMESFLLEMKRMPSRGSSASRCSTASSDTGRQRRNTRVQSQGPPRMLASGQPVAAGETWQEAAAARAEANDARGAEKSKAAAPRRSFMEQFGYGVRPKDVDPLPFGVPPAELLPQKKADMFVSISAGNNDLLERLARQKKLALQC